MNVKTAIMEGDAGAIRQLLAQDKSRANELIEWGNKKKCLTHPLHFISDMLFSGILQKGKVLPLVEALIEAGANVDFSKDGRGETALIGAASLGSVRTRPEPSNRVRLARIQIHKGGPEWAPPDRLRTPSTDHLG